MKDSLRESNSLKESFTEFVELGAEAESVGEHGRPLVGFAYPGQQDAFRAGAADLQVTALDVDSGCL
ncbi:hypothetical protein [Amycolatopsis sp. WGS_07]|uniref:hypothetical protein n=1 Tax=Amycolatopsis sp. WGS_07 TaxID=3076764 RepID=UPI003873206C